MYAEQLIITEEHMRCVANYMKYFKSVDQFCLLNICRAREYNVPEIYNAFTIVNKKQLNELLNDYNASIDTLKL